MNIENKITNIEDLPLSLTAKDVARVLGVSLEHAYKLIHRKEFPSVQIGKRLVVPKPAFEKWMENPFYYERN
jgi:excisionase family DNA binding protein